MRCKRSIVLSSTPLLRPVVEARHFYIVHEQRVKVIFRKVIYAQHTSLPIKFGVVGIERVTTAPPDELLLKVVLHLGTHSPILIAANLRLCWGPSCKIPQLRP